MSSPKSSVEFKDLKQNSDHFEMGLAASLQLLQSQQALASDGLGLQTQGREFAQNQAQAHFNWDLSKLEKFYRDPKTIMIGAFEENTLAGLLGAVQIEAEVIEIQLVLVHPERRKLGYGYKMIEFLKSSTCSPGQCLWLEVHAENHAALQLYKKLGFQIDGERKRYYADGGSAFNMSLKV